MALARTDVNPRRWAAGDPVLWHSGRAAPAEQPAAQQRANWTGRHGSLPATRFISAANSSARRRPLFPSAWVRVPAQATFSCSAFALFS